MLASFLKTENFYILSEKKILYLLFILPNQYPVQPYLWTMFVKHLS